MKMFTTACLMATVLGAATAQAEQAARHLSSVGTTLKRLVAG